MNKIKISEAREIIQQLNRANLDIADYNHIAKQIDRLTTGMHFSAFAPNQQNRLYRGIKYTEKPKSPKELGYPPARIVRSFQRCNPPGEPMFYCTPDIGAVLFELDAKQGDIIYLSKWSVTQNFFLFPIEQKFDETNASPLQLMIATFFETKFIQPIHETFSSQYKITAAITKKFSTGNVENADILLGGITYPSVAHPNRSENLAIKPEIADTCLSLDYVKEIRVSQCDPENIEITSTDFASKFDNETISWSGRAEQWSLEPNQTLTFTTEHDGYIARDLSGKIVNPT